MERTQGIAEPRKQLKAENALEWAGLDTAANAWEERQKIVNGYLEPALQICFSRLGENPFEGVE